MINKKVLIILGATTILLTGLSTMVFSKYQTTIDDTTGTVTAKSFIINTLDDANIEAGTTNYNESDIQTGIKLGPGEYLTKNFSIQNFGDGKISESNIYVDVGVIWETTITPLSLKLYKIDEDGSSLVKSLQQSFEFDGVTDVESGLPKTETHYLFKMLGGTRVINDFQVVIEWNDYDLNGNPYDQKDYKDGTATYKIDVVGTQIPDVVPEPEEVIRDVFVPMLQDKTSVISRYMWCSGTIVKGMKNPANGKWNDWTNGTKTSFVDSTGVNYGVQYITPYIANKLNISLGTVSNGLSYKIARLSQNYFNLDTRTRINDNFPFDLYLYYGDINTLNGGARIDGVYKVSCQDGYLRKYKNSRVSKNNANAGVTIDTFNDDSNVDSSFTPIQVLFSTDVFTIAEITD